MPKKIRKSKTAILKETQSSISDLKKQVRKKVANGQSLSRGSKLKELEAREIQIKIAGLEHKAERASVVSKKKKTTSPALEQTVRKQTDALRRKLKP